MSSNGLCIFSKSCSEVGLAVDILAHADRVQVCNLGNISQDELDKFEHWCCAFICAQTAPHRKSLSGCIDGGINILSSCLMDITDLLLCCWVADFEGLASLAADELILDEHDRYKCFED